MQRPPAAAGARGSCGGGPGGAPSRHAQQRRNDSPARSPSAASRARRRRRHRFGDLRRPRARMPRRGDGTAPRRAWGEDRRAAGEPGAATDHAWPRLLITGPARADQAAAADLVRGLRASRPEVAILVGSGRDTADAAVEAMKAGAGDYVVLRDPEGLARLT